MFDSPDFSEFTVSDINIDYIDSVVVNCNSGVATEREHQFAALLLLLDYICEDGIGVDKALYPSTEYYALIEALESET